MRYAQENQMLIWEIKGQTDLLSRGPLIQSLANAIISSDASCYSSVGLYGDWGSGKSFCLEELGKLLRKDENVIVISIDAWLIRNENEFLTSFLHCLYSECDSSSRSAIAKLAYIAAYGVASAMTSMVSAGTMSIDTLTGAEAAWGDQSGAPVVPVIDFRVRLGKILDKLSRDGKKIVVLIDNLDRCGEQCVLGVLENLHLFFSVPGVTTILAADQDVLNTSLGRALESRLHDGEEASSIASSFLEKIIQVPIRLPIIDQRDIKALVEAWNKDLLSDSRILEALYLSCKTARRVKQVLNQYGLMLATAESKGQPASDDDCFLLFCMSVIAVEFPDAFRSIRDSPKVLEAMHLLSRGAWTLDGGEAPSIEGVGKEKCHEFCVAFLDGFIGWSARQGAFDLQSPSILELVIK